MEIKRIDQKVAQEFSNREWKRFFIKEFGDEVRKFFENSEVGQHLGIFAPELKGIISFDILGGVCEVKDFIVKKESRGKGFGKILLQYLEKICKEKGCHKIRIETLKNSLAYEFYLKNGYEPECELKNDKIKRTWVIMVKYL